MARGWESKSVADQIEEGEPRLPERPADPDRSRRRDSEAIPQRRPGLAKQQPEGDAYQ